MRFEKVNYNEWYNALKEKSSYTDEEIKEAYDNIKLPTRATNGSAGYDFFYPFKNTLKIPPMAETLIPTGIKWICDKPEDKDKVLLIDVRSGQGFKYGLKLANTIGVIDNDYNNPNNEGHIMLKFFTDNKEVEFEDGKGIAQGIITQFFTVENENEITTTRKGGFGSTDNK